MTGDTLISELEELLSGRIEKKKSNGNYVSRGQFGRTHVTKCHLCISFDSCSHC